MKLGKAVLCQIRWCACPHWPIGIIELHSLPGHMRAKSQRWYADSNRPQAELNNSRPADGMAACINRMMVMDSSKHRCAGNKQTTDMPPCANSWTAVLHRQIYGKPHKPAAAVHRQHHATHLLASSRLHNCHVCNACQHNDNPRSHTSSMTPRSHEGY